MNLWSDFPTPTSNDWKKKLKNDLKNDDLSSLKWKHSIGDIDPLIDHNSNSDFFLKPSKLKSLSWKINHSNYTNSNILKTLSFGINSLIFDNLTYDEANFKDVMHEIIFQNILINHTSSNETRLLWIKWIKNNHSKCKGSFRFDPIQLVINNEFQENKLSDQIDKWKNLITELSKILSEVTALFAIFYVVILESAKSYLSSSDSQTINRLRSEIDKASKNLEYEKAADIRDRLKRLEILREEQSVVTLAKDIDIFSIYSANNYLGVSIIVVRRGKIRGTKTHLIKQPYYESIEDVYQTAIINFYDTQLDVPKKILCTHALETKDLVSKVIKKKFGVNTNITHTPSKSIRPIYNLCKLNAKQVIQNHLSKADKYNFALDQLGSLIGINTLNHIETYDVSHLSGDHAVTSCVVFDRNGPSKKLYRSFNIPSNLAGNDIGSLEHTLQRRIKRYDENNIVPDLILIDGGKNQLNFIQKIIAKSKYSNIKVLSIVKGVGRVRATETILSKEGILEIDNKSSAYLLLQEMRDEAHRFAIQAQRKKKQKTTRYSELDSIDGVGKITKKILLKEFKSLSAIKLLSIQQLESVKGINHITAVSIYNTFNQ